MLYYINLHGVSYMICPKCGAKMHGHGTVALVRRGKVKRYRCPECGKTITEKEEK
jgi:predicted RNA-binding Zn-ribbon protein involved in translation (DUF1610 family)